MKRFISLFLAVLLAVSAVTTVSAYSVYPDALTSEEAVENYEMAYGTTVPTHRYYFQMPNGNNGPVATQDVIYYTTDEETGAEIKRIVCRAGEHAPSWYNDYTEGAGVYWWQGPAACDSWAGYKAMVADADQDIYYVDMPEDVVMFIWNNGVDGGWDSSNPIYYCAAQTFDVPSEYPDPGEYATIPEGADSFDNMIVIVDPDSVNENPLSRKLTCGFDWYFYYGDGCYGSYAEDSASFTGIENECLNPDHYVDGVHVGAVQEEPVASGITGDCTWSLDNKGTLTISGSGAMADYSDYHYSDAPPWGRGIKSVVIGKGVTNIGAYAFNYSPDLAKVTISNTVTEIGGCAFERCTSLDNVSIPNSVTEIGWGAFYECSALKNIVFGSGLAEIGPAAFRDCTSLTKVDLPSSLRTIGNSAFADSGLRSVDIPFGVTGIDNYAFVDCMSLTKAVIPESVNEIGSYAFGYYLEPGSDGPAGTIDGFTIYGYSGTEAEYYANENGFTFVSTFKPAITKRLPVR